MCAWRKRLLLALVVALAAASAGRCLPSAWAGDGSLTGGVYDALTGQAIAGAAVKSIKTGLTAVTGTDGTYALTGLDDYLDDWAVVSAPGYDSHRDSRRLSSLAPELNWPLHVEYDWFLLPLGNGEKLKAWHAFASEYAICGVSGIAVAPNGHVYVASNPNNMGGTNDEYQLVQEFTQTGEFVREWGGWGLEPGKFLRIGKIAVAGDGSVFVVDEGNERVQRFTSEGMYLGEIRPPAGYLANLVAACGDVVFIAVELPATPSNGEIGWYYEVRRYGVDGVFEYAWPVPYLGADYWDPGAHPGVMTEDMAVASDGTLYIINECDGVSQIAHVTRDGVPLRFWRNVVVDGSRTCAVGPDGNLYFGSAQSDRAVLVCSPKGTTVRAWGERGISAGELSYAIPVAADPQGLIYVSDTGNGGIHCYDLRGAFIRRWGSGGDGPGEFGEGAGGATGESYDITAAADGSIYITDNGNARMQHLGSDGSFLAAWGGIGTEPGKFAYGYPEASGISPEGTVYVIDAAGRMQRFDATGKYLGEFQCSEVQRLAPSRTDVAVASEGTIYSVVWGQNAVFRRSPTEAALDTWFADAGASLYGLALTATGGVYALGTVWAEGSGGHAAAQSVIYYFGAQGEKLGEIRYPATREYTGLAYIPAAIAVAPDGSLYLTMVAASHGPRLLHLANDGALIDMTPLDELGPAFRIEEASGIAVAPTGLIWVGDSFWHHRLVALYRGTFPDVPAWDWAHDAVEAVAAAGIATGYPDGCYAPRRSVTRDQMAVYIARALAGGDEYVQSNPVKVSFPDDVPSGSPAYKYVEYTVTQGVVEGYDATHYLPDAVVDRGQMAVFVARARGWVNLGDDMTTAPQVFPDVPAGYWAGTAIKACVDHGVVQGYLDGLYHPGDPVTRDQMAVYIARAFQLPV